MNYSTETVPSTVIRTATRMKAFLNGIYKGPNKNMPPDLLSILLLTKKKEKKGKKPTRPFSFSGKLPCNMCR